MFFSGKLVRELVIKLARDEEFSHESIQNLIYHLKLPGSAIPLFIAEVIAERLESVREDPLLPGRLAFGILDDALIFFDKSEQHRRQKRLCRQVEHIEIGLKKLERPVHLIDIFDEEYSTLVFAAEAANDLGSRSQELSHAELASLTERILEAFLLETSITRKLLTRVIDHLQRDEKNRLESRLSNGINEGIRNEPWNDREKKISIFHLDEPVRFRQSLIELDRFDELAWETLESVTRLCRM